MYFAEKTLNLIHITELPALRVASHKVVSSKPVRTDMFYMKDLIQWNGLNYHDLRIFGFDVQVSQTQQKMGLRGYEFWICLPDDFKNPAGTTIKKIPGGRFAILRIKNPFERPYDHISNGWLELHDWVQNSIYRSAIHHPDKYMLEELLVIDGITFIDLFYPVSTFEHPN